MILSGPVVATHLYPDKVVAEVMAMAGEAPHPLPVHFMLDTGADISMVESSAAIAAGLRQVRYERVAGISQKVEVLPVFLGVITLGVESDAGPPRVLRIPVTLVGGRTAITEREHQGLLGRDFLADFRFAYDGDTGAFALAPLPHLLIED